MSKFAKRMPRSIQELKSQPRGIDYGERLEYLKRRSAASNCTKDNKLRLRIFQRDGFVCVLCGSTDQLTVDHIISVYRGGTNDDDNLQTLCNRCNAGKAV